MRQTTIGIVTGGLCAALAAGALAQSTSTKPVVTRDAADDAVEGGLDVTRAQLGRGGDGRLRGVITLAEEFGPLDLLASSGPPGSLCLRLWADPDVRPSAAPPTHLVCVTGARSGAAYRASVQRLTADGEPERIGRATVTRPSKRSLTLRFSQTLVGAPRLIRWQADATKPGCARASCTDTAPDAPRSVTLRLAP